MDSKEAFRYMEEHTINRWKDAIDAAAEADTGPDGEDPVTKALDGICNEAGILVTDLGAETVPDFAAIYRGLGLLLER